MGNTVIDILLLVELTGLKFHLFCKFWLREACWQDVSAELYGRPQFDECDVVVIGVLFVFIVGDDSFHFVQSFIAIFLQRIKFT